MKKIKIYLMSMVAIIMLVMSTQVFADENYVDPENAITMPSALSEGKGTVSTSISGDTNYQFIEINSSKYETIKKYEAIYDLIYAYIHSSDNYETLAENYRKTYNQTINGITTTYGISLDKSGLNAIRALWVSELTTYNESSWTHADGKTISVDLTTFEGTKYYIAWVKIGDTYDAEVYKVTGTKTNKEETGTGTEGNDEKENEGSETGTAGSKNPGSTTTSNGTKNNGSKKTDTTVSAAKKLPQTGINSFVLLLILGLTNFSIVSYKKYRNIK